MKTKLARLLLLGAAALVAFAPSAFAQRQLGKKKGPTSKIYLAEAVGDSQIQTGEKIYSAKQATAFDAPGTVIETGVNAHTVLVCSNGTGLTVGENSHLEINRFEQAPFTAAANADTAVEPSVSLCDIHLARGTVGVTTSELLSGSTMFLTTPLATLNVRGGQMLLTTTDDETIIDLLEGDATVRGGDKDPGGYVMHPGERVIIRRGGPGQPFVIVVSQIPPDAIQAATILVTLAANARKTVTFESIEKQAGTGPTTGGPTGETNTQEIVTKPTVPANPPTNIVISPDRLPGN